MSPDRIGSAEVELAAYSDRRREMLRDASEHRRALILIVLISGSFEKVLSECSL